MFSTFGKTIASLTVLLQHCEHALAVTNMKDAEVYIQQVNCDSRWCFVHGSDPVDNHPQDSFSEFYVKSAEHFVIKSLTFRVILISATC